MQHVTGTRAVRLTITTLVALVLSVLPAFMVGGMAVLLRQDLGFSESRLGTAISAFYVTSAAVSVLGGRLSQRIGGMRATDLGVLVSTVALLGIAGLTRTWLHLVLWLAVAGVANAVIQPSTNLVLARAVPRRRQGLAFGIKQTNGPIATLLAGASLPAIGLTLGWRWAFVLGALGVVGFRLLVPGRIDAPPPPEETGRVARPRSALWLLAAGAGCGVATAMALVGFYTESAVASGHSVAFAGGCFAFGSAVGVLARPAWGWWADRRGSDGLRLVAGLLVIGSASFALLGVGSGRLLLAAATVLVFVTGWGWVGLLLFGVVRVAPAAPGHATGIINVGISLGGIVGPSAFGIVVERAGYPVAWAGAAAVTAVAGVLVEAGARTAARHRRAEDARMRAAAIAPPDGTPVDD